MSVPIRPMRWLRQLFCAHSYIAENGKMVRVRRCIDRVGPGHYLSYDHGFNYIFDQKEICDGVCCKCGHVRLDATKIKLGGERTKNLLRSLRGESEVESGTLSLPESTAPTAPTAATTATTSHTPQ